jgi:hexosaminidase
MPERAALACLTLTLVLAGCRSAGPLDTRAPLDAPTALSHAVVPAPASVDLQQGTWFTVQAGTPIVVAPATTETLTVGAQLAAWLRPATGFALPVVGATAAGPEPTITLALDTSRADLGDEGYELEVTRNAATLRAPHGAGLFYAAQTLRQLLPASIEQPTVQREAWRVPAGRIVDRPRFAWRGAMLDVARHFFGVDDVKRYIDLLAKYKINRLHLHLSDDQGWRIEILSWPRLTTHGGSTAVGGGPGGYYTQAQYREIVAYAADRHIVIVPEIDMPGHTNAALASYAELNCDDVAPPLYTGIEVGFSALCVDRDITYRFIDDVVREIAAMTPGPYFHVGGDEVEKLTDEQYARFIERVQEIVIRHGKHPIGWEEVTKARLAPAFIVQQWQSDARAGTPPWRNEAALSAVQQGVALVLSPAAKVYLDMKYDANTTLGLKWAGYVEVRDAYDWDPATQFEGIGERDVLGVEAPLWSETLVTMADVEMMAFPRLPGIAEVGWSPPGRVWEEYRERLAAHAARWTAMGVTFHRSPQVPWPEPRP